MAEKHKPSLNLLSTEDIPGTIINSVYNFVSTGSRSTELAGVHIPHHRVGQAEGKTAHKGTGTKGTPERSRSMPALLEPRLLRADKHGAFQVINHLQIAIPVRGLVWLVHPSLFHTDKNVFRMDVAPFSGVCGKSTSSLCTR